MTMPDKAALEAIARAVLQDKADVGGVMFMLCRCQRKSRAKPRGFIPVAESTEDGLSVLAMVCPSCGEVAYLANGVVLRVGQPEEM